MFAVCNCPQLLASNYDTRTDNFVADWGQQQWECWLLGCPRYRGGQLAGNMLQGTGYWTADRDAQTIVVAAPAAENVSHLIRAKLLSPHACLLKVHSLGQPGMCFREGWKQHGPAYRRNQFWFLYLLANDSSYLLHASLLRPQSCWAGRVVFSAR